MQAAERTREEKIFLYIGSVCAILGTVLSVLAGIGYYVELSTLSETEAVLRFLNSRPVWYWPAVQLSFSLGSLLWLGSLSALTYSLKSLSSWIVGRIGTASIVLGTTIHLIHAALSGYGLTTLANAWPTASPMQQTVLLQNGTQLLLILQGLWIYVMSFFYGLPFILYGLSTALSRNYPAWLGWIGMIGGAGSFISGMLLLFQPTNAAERLFLGFAILTSLWMLIMGILMAYKATTRKHKLF